MRRMEKGEMLKRSAKRNKVMKDSKMERRCQTDVDTATSCKQHMYISTQAHTRLIKRKRERGCDVRENPGMRCMEMKTEREKEIKEDTDTALVKMNQRSSSERRREEENKKKDMKTIFFSVLLTCEP